jgi:hypothetical protein
MTDFKFFHGFTDDYEFPTENPWDIFERLNSGIHYSYGISHDMNRVVVPSSDYEVPTENRREAFERLMSMLHDMDRVVEPSRGYEIPEDDVLDWDVTLSDGLGEE